MIGTIVAERLLDVGVILVLFLVVGYAILGNVGTALGRVDRVRDRGGRRRGAVAIVLVRRNHRIHDFVAPMLSSTHAAASADTARCWWP